MPIQNESGGHMRDGLLHMNKKLFLFYQDLKTCKTETSENSRQ